MIRIQILLASLILATNVYAKSTTKAPSIQAINFTNGIEFQVSDSNMDIQLTVVGPENSRISERFSGNAEIFLDVTDSQGSAMVDGFYKYEAWPIPAVTISREESMKMPDRNSLKHKARPSVSSVSGSFRIENGFLVDESVLEFNGAASTGSEE